MNRDLVADEELSCNTLKGILQNTINKTLLNDQYDMHLKQVKFESNTFLNNCGIN